MKIPSLIDSTPRSMNMLTNQGFTQGEIKKELDSKKDGDNLVKNILNQNKKLIILFI